MKIKVRKKGSDYEEVNPTDRHGRGEIFTAQEVEKRNPAKYEVVGEPARHWVVKKRNTTTPAKAALHASEAHMMSEAEIDYWAKLKL